MGFFLLTKRAILSGGLPGRMALWFFAAKVVPIDAFPVFLLYLCKATGWDALCAMSLLVYPGNRWWREVNGIRHTSKR